MPYVGEFHFTALRTLGTLRTMSASRRFPMARFQPGIAAMYARTGASPSAFAMRGLPPVRRTATFSPSRTLIGLASLAPGLAFAPAFGWDLDLVADLRGLLARDVPLAFALLSVIIRPFLSDVSQVALGVYPRTAHSTSSSRWADDCSEKRLLQLVMIEPGHPNA